MAFNHTHFNDQTSYGRHLRRALQMSEEADALLDDVRDMMIQMRDGDGSESNHYAEVTTRFGFVDNEQAKQAFDEIDKVFIETAKADVRTSRDQLFAKLRG